MIRASAALTAVVVATLLGTSVYGSGSDTPASGPLDGMVFVTTLDVDQYDQPFEDRMTFRDGMFFSEECQNACDFGWSAYHTRIEGDAIAVVIETQCSDAPQSVRWEGRVTGDRIEGTAVWTVRRFYWTVERTGSFSGTLEPGVQEQAAIRAE